MITGVVNSSLDATIRLLVSGPEALEQEIEATIDTGFSGSLSLPSSLIAALGLPFRRRGRAILADGSDSLFNIYEATVLWDQAPRRIGVHAADTDPLVGMNLLHHYELCVQIVNEGKVRISMLT